MSQQNEKTQTDVPVDDEEDEEFLKLLEGIEEQGTAMSIIKGSRAVDMVEKPSEVSPELAVVRGFRRELKAGRIKPLGVELCDHHGRKIQVN